MSRGKGMGEAKLRPPRPTMPRGRFLGWRSECPSDQPTNGLDDVILRRLGPCLFPRPPPFNLRDTDIEGKCQEVVQNSGSLAAPLGTSPAIPQPAHNAGSKGKDPPRFPQPPSMHLAMIPIPRGGVEPPSSGSKPEMLPLHHLGEPLPNTTHPQSKTGLPRAPLPTGLGPHRRRNCQ